MSPWKPFAPDPMLARAAALYTAIIVQARQPAFYATGGLPDSIDGRFEMVVLHSYLVLRRLRGAGEHADRLSQALVDALFADMDASLREMGAGDLGVGKRVKRMATAFYGRIAAYEAGEKAGQPAEAFRRNLFGTVTPTPSQLATMVAYANAAAAALVEQPLGEILAGQPAFPTLESTVQPATRL
jgi:cytochrome b pre-mRNA-processing protein 3